MSTLPEVPQVVKEFRFFSGSRFVIAVFEGDTTIEFHGEDNYHKARAASAHGRPNDQTTIELTDQAGKATSMVVNKGVLVEAFEA